MNDEVIRHKAIFYVGETVISAAQNREDVLINRAFRGKKTVFI